MPSFVLLDQNTTEILTTVVYELNQVALSLFIQV